MLLNKIDLVQPEEIILKWQKKLTKEHPCIAFKSGFIAKKQLKEQVNEDAEMKDETEAKVEAIGLSDLIKTLKKYAKETCEKD